ncbi:hypothetical protein BO71DRAFT_329980, partial [Aspergillus ellipticus CBS 707.79]
ICYLWADQLCIHQSDEAEKEEQYGQMDRIYECAFCTLVALVGGDSDQGLPGVTKPRPSYRMQIGNIALALQTIDPNAFIANSKWCTRGWTLQEYRLSQQLLYFSAFDIHFTTRSDGTRPGYKSDIYTGNIKGLPEPINSLSEYWKVLEHYSTRDLSHTEDILRAWRSILQKAHGTETYYGMPLHHMDKAGLWCPRTPYLTNLSFHQDVRRDGFPSWSWASYLGSITHFSMPLAGLAVWAIPIEGEARVSIAEPMSNMPFPLQRGDDILNPRWLVAAIAITWMEGCMKTQSPLKLERKSATFNALERRWSTYNQYWEDAEDAFGSYKDEINSPFSSEDYKTASSETGRILLHGQSAKF